MSQSGRANYSIKDGIAVVEIIGEESYEIFVDVHSRLAADPGFRPEMPKLLDVRRVTNFLGPQDLIKVRDLMVKLHAGAKTKRRIATVSQDIMAGKMARIYRDLQDAGPEKGRTETRFFSTIDDAVAWLKNDPKDDQVG